MLSKPSARIPRVWNSQTLSPTGVPWMPYRNLAIIGEAASHIPDAVCADHSDIPWTDMRSMRNFVVHEYFGISDAILWDTVTRNLPSLHEPLQRILESKGRLSDEL
ncbi:MAG: DUF86 domain-containing protein [Desulfomonilaceae bacterium]